ncbi:MAG: DUF2384 domain-containing protein [Gemmatimonadetes bacterium]|nr:DUF2384 domain-containing protein [Gemmatimonadota bacterium]
MTSSAPRIRSAAQADLGPAALRTLFRIADRWELSADQLMTLLGMTAPSTYYKWRNSPPRKLSPDLLERISYLFGIYKALQILLPEQSLADSWLRRPNSNPLFGGRAPLERMLTGQVADLFLVRRHLDAERGG